MSSGIAYGYLLDDFGALRDTCSPDGRIIISHGGGNAGNVKTDGIDRSILKGDQSEDAMRITALLNAAKQKTPIVLIAGSNYSELPWRLNKQRYVVLGWYWISAHWVEAEFPAENAKLSPDRPYFHRLKLRFDWCEAQGDPWWMGEGRKNPAVTVQTPSVELGNITTTSENSTSTIGSSKRRLTEPKHVHKLSPNPVSLPSDLTSICEICKLKSPRVYQEVICLQPTCLAFWRQNVGGKQSINSEPKVDGEDNIDGEKNVEGEQKVNCKQNLDGWKLIDGRSCLNYNPDFLKRLSTPASMSMLPHNLYDVKQLPTATARGFLCIACRKACCRADWSAPTCSNCSEVNPEYWPSTIRKEIGRSPGIGLDHEGGGVQWTVNEQFYTTRYSFDHIDSHIYHLRPLDTTIADDLWNDYLRIGSEQEGLLIRAAMREHAMRDELLSQQYTFNSGQAYKYLVATKSSSFEDSPDVVIRARDHVANIVRTTIPDEQSQFNQLMSVAYRPEQQMNWHDDGEAGLGPCIAAISLGSDSEFLVKRKKKGKSAPKPYRRDRQAVASNSPEPSEDADDEPTMKLDGEEDRLELHTAAVDKPKRNPPVLTLRLRLRHGDIVIMHGRRLQEYYQHKAEPSGTRVVGTLRSIDGQINSAANSLRKKRPT